MTSISDSNKIDLNHMVRDLAGVVGRWRQLGIQLDVPPDELDAIEGRVASPDICLERVVGRFLDTHPHSSPGEREKCRRIIVSALRAPAVSQGNLAQRIENGSLELKLTVRGLTETLECCTPQWQQLALGLELGYTFPATLRSEPRDTKQYFNDMLHYWLTNGSGSVDHLVAALKRLHKKNLADKIERDYAGKQLVLEISTNNSDSPQRRAHSQSVDSGMETD